MGQQQLLLVILLTIIVGIATVVAINTFGSSPDSARIDAVRQDLATIAASAQGYYMKPDMLGGGGRAFTGLEWSDIAFGGDFTDADSQAGTEAFVSNENAHYEFGTISTDNVLVDAYEEDGSTVIFNARICVNDIKYSDVGGGTPANCDS